jgi:hypothetical protein
MALWSSFYPDVLVYVPGAPAPVVDLALIRAAREFFDRTGAWKDWLEPVTTATAPTTGTNSYAFVLPTGYEIVRIERATNNGQDFDVAVHDQVPADPVYFANEKAAVASKDLVSFRVLASLPAGQAIQVQCKLRPTKTATGIPDHLFNHHCEAIAEGAKKILMLMPGAFFNPDLATVANGEFEAAIGKTQARAYMGRTATMPSPRTKWH